MKYFNLYPLEDWKETTLHYEIDEDRTVCYILYDNNCGQFFISQLTYKESSGWSEILITPYFSTIQSVLAYWEENKYKILTQPICY